jgi:hypothetical protein
MGNRGPAILAVLLALGLYAVTVGGTYIYDDLPLVLHDQRVSPPVQWKQIWTTEYFTGSIDNLYRPLVTSSFALEWMAHGERAWAFHLVNVILFAAAAGLTAELARRLGGLRVGYVAGVLFAAHPIHAEAVTEIVGRCELICWMFMAAGLVLFLRRPLTVGRAVAIGACSLAAMLSKEQGFLMPFLLIALAWCGGFVAVSARERNGVKTLTLIVSWAMAGLIVLREEVLGLKFEWPKNFLDVSIQPLIQSSAKDHFLMVLVILGRYAQLMIAPLRLSIDYGMSVMGSAPDARQYPYLWLGVAMLLASLALLIWAVARRQWVTVFCIFAAWLTYAMVSNVFLIATIFGERLMFVPSAFLLILAAIYLAKLPRPLLIAIVSVTAVLWGWRSVSYAARWNDRLSYYQVSLREQPRSLRLCEMLATELETRGDLPGAAAIAEQGIEAGPDYWNIWFLAGRIAEERGQLATADAMYHKAFKLQASVPLQNKIRELDAKLQSGG